MIKTVITILLLISIIECFPNPKAANSDNPFTNLTPDNGSHPFVAAPPQQAAASAAAAESGDPDDDFDCTCRPIPGNTNGEYDCKCGKSTSGTSAPAESIDAGVATALPGGGKPPAAPAGGGTTEEPETDSPAGATPAAGGGGTTADDTGNGEDRPPPTEAPDTDANVMCYKDTAKESRDTKKQPAGELLQATFKGKWVKYTCTLGPVEAFNVSSTVYDQALGECKKKGYDIAMPIVTDAGSFFPGTTTTKSRYNAFQVGQDLQEYIRENTSGTEPAYDQTDSIEADTC